MKISNMPQSQGGNPGRSLRLNTQGQGASTLDRARAIARGENASITLTPDGGLDPEVERIQNEVPKITMNTKATPGEYVGSAPAPAPAAAAPTAPAAPGAEAAPTPTPAAPAQPATPSADPASATPIATATPTPGSKEEEARAAAEETKPLSPQQAAFAKQRRALQVKEREIQQREKALEERASKLPTNAIDVGRLKADPLSVLHEAGVTYDQLTEALLSGQAPNPEIYKLREEIRALKEGVDRSLSDRDAKAETDALNAMEQEARVLAENGDDFALIRASEAVPMVRELIRRTWKEQGEVLPVPEAMRLVEEDLVNETLKRAALSKIQGRLTPKAPPAAPATPTTPPAAPSVPQAPAMKTLTNRDSASAVLSRRERAIQAAYGNKR